MFKVFIYLYIFLESVLCKTWFWLFAQSGAVGAAVMAAVCGSWALSQTAATEGEKGAPCTERGAAQDHLAYVVLTGECHPCQEGLSPLGRKQLLASSPLSLSSSLLVSCPVGRAPALFFFFFRHPPFSTQIPQSMQRVLQGLEVVPDLPSPKVQPAPCGLIRALQAWCHPGGCYLMVLPTHGVMELQVPSWAGDCSSGIL